MGKWAKRSVLKREIAPEFKLRFLKIVKYKEAEKCKDSREVGLGAAIL